MYRLGLPMTLRLVRREKRNYLQRSVSHSQIRPTSVSHAGHLRTVIEIGIWRTLDDQKAGKPSLYPCQCVIHDRVISRHMEFELGNDSAARRHGDGLDAF